MKFTQVLTQIMIPLSYFKLYFFVREKSMRAVLIRCFLSLALFILSFACAWSTTYYVDAVRGSDMYTGQAPDYQGENIGPWRTLSKVNSMTFAPGDSILFKRGSTWYDGPLDPANGGAPGGVITIEETILSQPIRFELTDPGNHRSIYFGAYSRGAKPKIACRGGQGLVIRHNYIIVENLHLEEGGNNALAFARPEGNFWNVVRNIDITGCTGNAVRFQRGGGHCWLSGLYIYDYAVNGIYLEGSAANPLKNVLVENCHVEDPIRYEKEDGISCHRDADGNNIQGDIIIRNNTIIRAGEDGIDVTSGTNILLAGNTVENCLTGGIYVAKDRVNTVEIRGNFLNSNSLRESIGDLTIACSKVRAVNNIIAGTGHHSLLIEDASEVQIWNNVIAPSYRTGKFIWLVNNTGPVEFRNNIFDFSSTSQEIEGALESATFDYNCYYTPSRSQALYDGLSFDELQDANAAFEPNGFWANPQFAGAEKTQPDHFMLSNTSPCLDRGTDVDLDVDYWLTPRPSGARFDIGVFESSALDNPCAGAAAGQPCVTNIKITESDDDVEESVSKGSVSMSSSDLELVFDTDNQIVGLRFNNIPVAPQDQVAEAYVQFTADEINSGSTAITIFGEDTDNAIPFTNTAQNVSNRLRTNAFVDWRPPAWYIIGAAGVDQRTPNLAKVIQEIVDRPGWQKGNSMVFLFTGSGKRVAKSYNGSPNEAPVLHIKLGDLCPPAGTACDDGDPTTTNDVEDGQCNCEGTFCPPAGTPCNDGDPTTTNDVEDGRCNCEGTPCPPAGTACDDGDPTTTNDVEDGRCNCEGTPCPAAGTPCNDGDPTTTDDVEDGQCNCEGTSCPPAGTACNDGDPTTTNDVEDGRCNCEGTPCPAAGTPCNDGDPLTRNDVEDGNCNCEGTPCPAAGTPCNDGNPNTYNDVEDGNCNCGGGSCPPAGTPCSDGDPNTLYDVEDGNCNCEGVTCPPAGTPCDDGNPATLYDYEDGSCNCVGSTCPPAGTACDDGNPNTFNDREDGDCNCAGTPCPPAGTACNDGNPNTFNDKQDGRCNCVGTPCPPAGTACDDGDPRTVNDVEDGNCNCAGSACPPAGTPCDDRNPGTFNDVLDGDCNCAGTPCPPAGTACDDGDPNTVNDAEDGFCNCTGVSEQTTDYCNSRGGFTTFEWIETILINGRRFPSGDNGGYYDHTNTLAAAQAGQLLSLELIIGYHRSITVPHWRIWIDYNQNGRFESATEMVFQFRNPLDVVRTQIALPATLRGRYQMRVSMKWGAYPEACESFIWGEVEDFVLLVSGTPSTASAVNESGDLSAKDMRPSGKEAALEQKFSVFPDLSKGEVDITYWTLPEGSVQLSLWNEDGRRLVEWNWDIDTPDGQRTFKLPAGLKAGEYRLALEAGGLQYSGVLKIE